MGSLKLIDVENKNSLQKNGNLEESAAIINYVVANQLQDVFILTPFRNQKDVLDILLREAIQKGSISSDVKCGTIHQVQGQENKTIIISTSISERTATRSYDWIKNNSQLINVGVTRAKENLVVATDCRSIGILSRKDDDLYALIEYVRNNGSVSVAQSTRNRFTIGYSNDSRFENEFYKTMFHYCTIKGGNYKRNVRIISVLPDLMDDPNFNKKEFDGVLYEGQTPKIVFEINGREHYNSKRTIESDRLKMDLLKSKDIQLIMIPNAYVKHYEFFSN